MKTIQIIWSTEDVIARAKEDDIELTEDQADEILDNLKANHDASIGINWEVIDVEITNYLS